MNVTVTTASAVSFLIVLFTIQAELTLNSQQQDDDEDDLNHSMSSGFFP